MLRLASAKSIRASIERVYAASLLAASDDVYAPLLAGDGESDGERHPPAAELSASQKRRTGRGA